MEIADNQHPIDLSRKCGYYEQSKHYNIKPNAVAPSRPLPDLIPISKVLHDGSRSTKKEAATRSPFVDYSRDYDQLGFQSKERSTVRKELSRQRSMPQLASTSKMRKSNSDTRIPFLRTDAGDKSSSSSVTFINHSSVPMHRNGAIERGGLFYNSSCFAPVGRLNSRYGDEEVSSSGHMQPKKYVKQGPGVSSSTIQCLRKMLDKRKSMQKDS